MKHTSKFLQPSFFFQTPFVFASNSQGGVHMYTRGHDHKYMYYIYMYASENMGHTVEPLLTATPK